jgi:hypothetical protein
MNPTLQSTKGGEPKQAKPKLDNLVATPRPVLRSRSLDPSVLHTDPQLPIRFVDRPDRVRPVPVEVVGGVFQMTLGGVQRTQSVFDFGMPFEGG